MIQDLTKVENVGGRVDVLAYKLLEQYTHKLEEKYGLKGVWEVIKPHVNELVVKHVSGYELPSEARMLLAIIQANYKG